MVNQKPIKSEFKRDVLKQKTLQINELQGINTY